MKYALLLSALMVLPAHAEFQSGNTLLAALQETDYFSKGYAMGYIVGVADTTQGITQCMAPSATAKQAQDIVLQFLLANPAIRNKTADLLVQSALKQVWPCPVKPKGSSI